MTPSATVTSNRIRIGERYISSGCNCFVKSDATKIADTFFHENKIYNLNFKCKTWNKIKRLVDKLNIEALKIIFPEECTIRFSHKTGCSCGCSPGYRVRNVTSRNFAYYNNNVYVTVKVDTTKFENMLPKFKQMLEEEISANTVLVS